MSRYTVRPIAGKRASLEIDGFSGLDIGSIAPGQLTDAHNMHVLSGGALHTLLSEKKITLSDSEPLGGVYTLYSLYDARYEKQVTPEWVYQNICPEAVMHYENNLQSASRILLADVGMPGKVNGGYRHLIAAFSDGEDTYVLYDAVYNMIDQRRTDTYSKVGDGYTVQFYNGFLATEKTYAAAGTLTQLWMDRISPAGNVTALLISATFKQRTKLNSGFSKATLISENGKTCRYAGSGYLPDLGEAYNASPDAVYERAYPTLAADYTPISAWEGDMRRLVRYNNRTAGEGEYGAVGEKLLLLPDMRLLVHESDGWRIAEETDSIPEMTAAVQHFDRLFGIAGDRLYASASGNCTDYAVSEDPTAVHTAWETVTPSLGGFTAIASFDGQVVVFTASSMMTVRGTALPFSLSYVGAYGCRSQDAVAALGGWLYFASDGDILRYNGSRVESIGQGLPRDYVLADARLCTAGGLLAVSLIEMDGLYFYDPQSKSWSSRHGKAAIGFPGEGLMLASPGVVSVPYRIFGGDGDFSATVSLGCGAHRRLCAVTVTARLAPQAVLQVKDAAGNTLLQLDDVYGETVTRTAALPGVYTDMAEFSLTGKGDVTLYCLRVQYVQLGYTRWDA